jgi:hypothetical protein|tara:strand:+ start:1974 stop:2600 length:627 start_codon:yes stop_codon:yes gene_type:complete
MLDLNNVPSMDGGDRDFELIPDGTVVSGIVKLSGGTIEIPEYGAGRYFKESMTTTAKWLPIELTIVGGDFDKRKVWQNIFVDGDAKDENGISKARKIGLNTIKQMVDSGFNISPKDESENARAKRASIQGVHMLNGMNISCTLGIEKGRDGYPDRNKIKTVLTPDSPNYISSGNVVTGSATLTPPAQPAQAPTAPATPQHGVEPSWAR